MRTLITFVSLACAGCSTRVADSSLGAIAGSAFTVAHPDLALGFEEFAAKHFPQEYRSWRRHVDLLAEYEDGAREVREGRSKSYWLLGYVLLERKRYGLMNIIGDDRFELEALMKAKAAQLKSAN